MPLASHANTNVRRLESQMRTLTLKDGGESKENNSVKVGAGSGGGVGGKPTAPQRIPLLKSNAGNRVPGSGIPAPNPRVVSATSSSGYSGYPGSSYSSGQSHHANPLNPLNSVNVKKGPSVAPSRAVPAPVRRPNHLKAPVNQQGNSGVGNFLNNSLGHSSANLPANSSSGNTAKHPHIPSVPQRNITKLPATVIQNGSIVGSPKTVTFSRTVATRGDDGDSLEDLKRRSSNVGVNPNAETAATATITPAAATTSFKAKLLASAAQPLAPSSASSAASLSPSISYSVGQTNSGFISPANVTVTAVPIAGPSATTTENTPPPSAKYASRPLIKSPPFCYLRKHITHYLLTANLNAGGRCQTLTLAEPWARANSDECTLPARSARDTLSRSKSCSRLSSLKQK